MNKLLFVAAAFLVFTGCSPKLSPDETWGRGRWVVTQMKEVPVQQSGGRRDAFLQFSPTDKKLTGNGGCNRLTGSYDLKNNKRIKFNEIASTKMSCEDIAFETALLEVLRNVDRYTIDGSTMRLFDGSKRLLELEAK